MSADVLILNRNFFAIHVTNWQRAVTLLALERAMVVDEEYNTYNFQDWIDLSQTMSQSPGGFIHTPTLRIAIPEVIALKVFEKVPNRQVPVTRRNIYQHYGYRCCYCGKHLPPAELNLEHITPRSRGGGSDWNNVVTACIPCNLRKGNRMPAEAGMRLIVTPSRPKLRAGAAIIVRSPVQIRRAWQRFIDNVYWDSQLED